MTKIVNDKYYTPAELAKRLIETTFKEFAQSIAMKKMSMMRFYKYLGENMEGLE